MIMTDKKQTIRNIIVLATFSIHDMNSRIDLHKSVVCI